MRPCPDADEAGARSRAGAGQTGCPLRRIDEGGRGASEDWGKMDVPGRDTQLWASWVGASGARREKAFVKGGESDGRWRQKEYYEIGRDEKMKENCRVVGSSARHGEWADLGEG